MDREVAKERRSVAPLEELRSILLNGYETMVRERAANE